MHTQETDENTMQQASKLYNFRIEAWRHLIGFKLILAN